MFAYLDNRKILVVDDMKVHFLVFQKMLSIHNLEVLYESDPEKVIAVAEALQPAVILLDFEMPKLNGPDVCRILRRNPNTKNIPIIFVTSETKDIKLEAAFDAGADDYVVKPVREKELLSRIKRILENNHLSKKVKLQFEEQVALTRIISHDINNFLTLASLGVERLQTVTAGKAGPLDADINVNVGRIKKALSRMAELTANVRQLQSLEDEKVAIKLQPVLLHSVLEEAREVFAEKLRTKEIELVINCPADLKVEADASSLSMSVINNIISNAIKFTRPKGRVKVEIEEDGGRVVVIISDNGIGMDQTLLKNIFSKSYKTTRRGTGDEAGTGFGMPIVKAFMEQYGGSIDIVSKSIDQVPEDSGTSVYLEFKRAN